MCILDWRQMSLMFSLYVVGNSYVQQAKVVRLCPCPSSCVCKCFIISKPNLTTDRLQVATSRPRPLRHDDIAAGNLSTELVDLVRVPGSSQSSGAYWRSRAEPWMDSQWDHNGSLKFGRNPERRGVFRFILTSIKKAFFFFKVPLGRYPLAIWTRFFTSDIQVRREMKANRNSITGETADWRQVAQPIGRRRHSRTIGSSSPSKRSEGGSFNFSPVGISTAASCCLGVNSNPKVGKEKQHVVNQPQMARNGTKSEQQ